MQPDRRAVLGGLAAATALSAHAIVRAQAREPVMVGYGNEQVLPLIQAGEELRRRHPGVRTTVEDLAMVAAG